MRSYSVGDFLSKRNGIIRILIILDIDTSPANYEYHKILLLDVESQRQAWYLRGNVDCWYHYEYHKVNS